MAKVETVARFGQCELRVKLNLINSCKWKSKRVLTQEIF